MGASWEKGAEEGGGERGAASHSQLPHTSVWTFISDTKEEEAPGGGRGGQAELHNAFHVEAVFIFCSPACPGPELSNCS